MRLSLVENTHVCIEVIGVYFETDDIASFFILHVFINLFLSRQQILLMLLNIY
jgi:hypothetical protein